MLLFTSSCIVRPVPPAYKVFTKRLGPIPPLGVATILVPVVPEEPSVISPPSGAVFVNIKLLLASLCNPNPYSFYHIFYRKTWTYPRYNQRTSCISCWI
jgi:hypothetical protein